MSAIKCDFKLSRSTQDYVNSWYELQKSKLMISSGISLESCDLSLSEMMWGYSMSPGAISGHFVHRPG